jgi:hypothetical protein
MPLTSKRERRYPLYPLLRVCETILAGLLMYDNGCILAGGGGVLSGAAALLLLSSFLAPVAVSLHLVGPQKKVPLSMMWLSWEETMTMHR